MKSRRIRAQEYRSLFLLSGELHDVSAADPETAFRVLVPRLTGLIGGFCGMWMASARNRSHGRADPLLGWRPARVFQNNPDPAALRRMIAWRTYEPNMLADPTIRAAVRKVGKTRALLRGELVDDAVHEASPVVHELDRPCGIYDRLVSAVPFGPNLEVHCGVNRGRDDRPFDEHDRNLLLAAAEGLAGFHARLARSCGHLGADGPLTPREKELLNLLLSGQEEKRIARDLGLTAGTVHQMVLRIYRKYRVSNRAELVAKCVR